MRTKNRALAPEVRKMALANRTTKSAWLLLLTAFAATASCRQVSAQEPWCADATRIEAPMIPFPPLARAAHVSGAVIGRLLLSEQGTVQKLDVVSGPGMLVSAVDAQVKKWKFRPQQLGPHECQVLLIVEFTLDREENPDKTPAPTSGIKVWINGFTPVVYTNYSRSAD
jgi:outer membrane biosynthesis protein TonB